MHVLIFILPAGQSKKFGEVLQSRDYPRCAIDWHHHIISLVLRPRLVYQKSILISLFSLEFEDTFSELDLSSFESAVASSHLNSTWIEKYYRLTSSILPLTPLSMLKIDLKSYYAMTPTGSYSRWVEPSCVSSKNYLNQALKSCLEIFGKKWKNWFLTYNEGSNVQTDDASPKLGG